MTKKHGILWGVDYYPEQWNKSFWGTDAQKMQKMGIGAVRMMEFAWAIIEPAECVYDFSIFDTMLEICAKHEIKVVLGTPTATFPVWLYEKDPEIVQIHPGRLEKDFGCRRQGCFNSETYLSACRTIVAKVAQHFGHNPNVIGWQIDNEIGHEGSDRCVCSSCVKKWHTWLEQKYQNIQALNELWGTVFWGTMYSRFDQIPVPRVQVCTGHNPCLILDYDRFCSESAVRFANMQQEILRQYISSEQWITTNLFPTPHSTVIDMERMCEHLDFVSYDNYPAWGDQDEPIPYYYNAYLLSYIRGLKEQGNYAIMEEFSGIQGHTCLGYLPPDGQVVLWTNQAIARGADTVFYFNWRTASYGQEQLCYGLHDSDESPTSRCEALAANIRKNGEILTSFANEPVESKACLVYDKDNSRILKEQYLSKGLYFAPTSWMQIGYDLEFARYFAPYVLFNVNADVKSAQSADLDRYKIVSLPLYEKSDEAFVKRLSQWVENGGHLILGWRAGARDSRNHNISIELPGLFATMAGIKIKRFESLNKTQVRIKIGFFSGHGEVWAEIVEPTTAKPLAYYADPNKHYTKAPCVTVNSYGKGLVYYFGTSPDARAGYLLYRKIFKAAKLNPKFYGVGIETVYRNTKDGKTIQVVLNHTDKAVSVEGEDISAYGMSIVR